MLAFCISRYCPLQPFFPPPLSFFLSTFYARSLTLHVTRHTSESPLVAATRYPSSLDSISLRPSSATISSLTAGSPDFYIWTPLLRNPILSKRPTALTLLSVSPSTICSHGLKLSQSHASSFRPLPNIDTINTRLTYSHLITESPDQSRTMATLASPAPLSQHYSHTHTHTPFTTRPLIKRSATTSSLDSMTHEDLAHAFRVSASQPRKPDLNIKVLPLATVERLGEEIVAPPPSPI